MSPLLFNTKTDQSKRQPVYHYNNATSNPFLLQQNTSHPSMEDTFRVRVDKTFNSLPSSSSSPSSSSQTLTPALWCLTDEEIEKRQWTREPDASVPVDDDDDDDDDNDGFLNSNVDKFFFAAAAAAAKDSNSKEASQNINPNPNPNPNELDSRKELVEDLKELDDDDDDNNGGEGCSSKSKVNNTREVVCGEEDDDELDVKKSIGMDCTLDFEEEEDAYDKVAVGAENIGPRLYMSDVTDYTSDITLYNELPNTFKEASRDPRANHLAAKLRLKEDAETARSFNSLHVSDQTDDASGAVNSAPEDGNVPKSILKRKDDQMDSKSGKRVRFDPICQTNDQSISDGDNTVLSEASNVDSTLVPDHVRHPLRYTHYTFDTSSDMNEESNRQAYMDFLNMVKKSKSEPEEDPADLTKPVIFNPKKKAVDASMTTGNKSDHTVEEPVQKKSISLSIASGNTEEEEASEMEVDVHEPAVLKVGNERRTARKYRSKGTVETNDPDS